MKFQRFVVDLYKNGESVQIYMDYAATTPVRKEVLRVMAPYFSNKFGNPSSLHSFGRAAAEALESSRSTVAKCIGAKPEEIVFTSGGTEGNNLAIKGAALAMREKGRHIITSAIEHHSVLNAFKWLESQGWRVTYLPVDQDGLVSLADVRAAITESTTLISIMHANNEIGTIEPIAGIGAIAKEKGIIFHVDAVQSFGKIPIDVKKLGVDLLTLSSHKIYGPKGVGALYIRTGTKIVPLAHGGEQERGVRSGTENVAGIVGFATAAKLAVREMPKESKRLTKLRDKLIDGILEMKKCRLNGHRTQRLPNNANFSFVDIEGEALVLRLDEKGIAASTGSACSSKKLEPSHVLLAIGLSAEMARGSLRLTVGKWTTEEHVKYVLKVLPKVVEDLRRIAKGGSAETEIE